MEAVKFFRQSAYIPFIFAGNNGDTTLLVHLSWEQPKPAPVRDPGVREFKGSYFYGIFHSFLRGDQMFIEILYVRFQWIFMKFFRAYSDKLVLGEAGLFAE